MRQYVLALVTSLAWLGCESDSIVVQPSAQLHTAILSIAPLSGRMGDAVTIYGAHFDSLRQLYSVSFNGTFVSVDQSTDSILRVRVPPGAMSGPVTVYTTNDSAVGPVFTVLASCAQNLCIDLYDGPALNEDESWHRDCFYRLVKWSGVSTSDSVTLSQGYCVGDDSHYTLMLSFKGYHGYPLPTIVEGSFVDVEIQGRSISALRGLVLVQSWDPHGIVSGKASWFDERSRSWRDFVFWYDFSL